jgi:ribosomal protein S19
MTKRKVKPLRIVANGEKRLLAAINALPLLEDKRDQAAKFSESLLIIGQLAGVNDRPSARECGKEQARAELLKFAKLAKALCLHINTMHKTSIQMISRDDLISPLMIGHELFCQLVLCGEAWDKLETLDPKQVKKQQKRQAEQVTKSAIRAYTILTGKRPTLVTNTEGKASGELHAFVKEVLLVLSVDASAESQIKKYMEKRSAEEQP